MVKYTRAYLDPKQYQYPRNLMLVDLSEHPLNLLRLIFRLRLTVIYPYM
jgi:hypothetical protein